MKPNTTPADSEGASEFADRAPRWELDRFPALWDPTRNEFLDLFKIATQPWDVLKHIDDYLAQKFAGLEGPRVLTYVPDGVHLEGPIFIDEDCIIEEGAFIRGPAWIGRGCEIRSGCYIRGGVLAGAGAVLGHASEFKHCVLLGMAQAPHFNYVGDSVMGWHAHIGAGVILSNFRLDGKPVPVRALGSGERIDSGLPKFGALIGDECEIGCNTVLNPGTILGEKSTAMPLSLLSGTLPAGSLINNTAMRRPEERAGRSAWRHLRKGGTDPAYKGHPRAALVCGTAFYRSARTAQENSVSSPCTVGSAWNSGRHSK